MATQVASEPASVIPTRALAAKVLDSPTGGAGLLFPNVPLGIALQLGALGIVLGLLSAANAELFSPAATGVVLPVAFSVGAIGIFAGGIINFRAGLLIAGVIGALYGTFWLSFGLLVQFFAAGVGEAAGPAALGDAIGTYLVIWAIVSGFLAVATFYVNRIVFAQQLLLTVVFLVLGLANMSAPGGTGLTQLGGWLGLVDALMALYISAALVINDTAGKELLPFR
ncbi:MULTISPECIES: acetate uptake transporter [Solirubrobacterales]|uniref:acetate uptake transporter n=1 Tax=Solirubrobacterales TaxID=588673 RepID=UPI0013049806|nr:MULTISPECIES: GPR1/FUN34/YaaH family transporter [Solirubrobacterales]